VGRCNPGGQYGSCCSAANQEFGSAAHYEGQDTDVSFLVAASIVATLNDGATQALIIGNYAGFPPAALSGTMTGAFGLPATVTLTASLPGYSGQLDMSTTEAAELVLSGATLVNVKADPATFEFDTLINSTAGTDVTSATSLTAALNNAASDTALGTTIGGSAVTATNGGGASNIVTVTADTAGSLGAMAITDDAAGRIVESASAMAKTMVTWTAALINASAAAIQALVDAGAAATAAGINTACNAIVGVSGIGVTAGNLADILAILAGRQYRMVTPVLKDPTGKNWDVTASGGFTTPNIVFGTQMFGGEWGPSTSISGLTLPDGTAVPDRTLKYGKEKESTTVGGDVVNNDIAGARETFHSTAFALSVASGQLNRYATAGVTLFPDPEVQASAQGRISRGGVWLTPLERQAPLLNQRIVTVYDDDGTLLV